MTGHRIGWSQCGICGRPLMDADSVRIGIGPGCLATVQRAGDGLPPMTKAERLYRDEVAGRIDRVWNGAIKPPSAKVVCRDGKSRLLSDMTRRFLLEALEDEFPDQVEALGTAGLTRRDLLLWLREMRMLEGSRR